MVLIVIKHEQRSETTAPLMLGERNGAAATVV